MMNKKLLQRLQMSWSEST